MGKVFTYSFEGTTVTFNHPQYGVYSAYGSGIGDLTVAFQDEVSSTEVASDLSVVISRHVKKRGNITLNILQSSDFNNWIKGWANYLENADVSQFADTTITIKNRTTGDTYYCTGCIHDRIADQRFTSEAGNRTWTIHCADISNQ